MDDDEKPEREAAKVPTLVLDDEVRPGRLLRDPWRFTRADLLRLAAFLAVVVVALALLALLVWYRLRIRALLVPVPHRARPAAGAPR